MVPWAWFLGQTSDCRIFQNMKVPDIITQIFQDNGFTDFEKRIFQNHPEREYCVQYRETALNFVMRLMEEEGIFFFFTHEKDKHTLVFGDAPDAHKPCPVQDMVRYELTSGGWQDDDVVLSWRIHKEVRPAKFALTDYNFKTPSTSLMVNRAAEGQYEVYDYPGEYPDRGEGDSLVRVRLEEKRTPVMVAEGEGDVRVFTAGARFTLEEHYREDQNQEYVITSVFHSASQGGDFRSGQSSEARYKNHFECIPFSTPIRPLRLTPTPTIQGSQTAVVVGPQGEEIFTDKYGRVKVQFHWDRRGKRNENSSCWIRVSQPWAGKGWGAVSIPRLGQEVVVDFLEGDPDRPLVTGRVYNAEQMPPYGLPAGAHMMGFRSNSTKGGGGYNEIVIHDSKSDEKIVIHAQKDMATTVEHDQSTLVVTGDQSNTVKTGNQTNTVMTGSQHNVTKKDVIIASTEDQIVISAKTKITLVVGANSLAMDKDGNIALIGKQILINGTDRVDINPGGGGPSAAAPPSSPAPAVEGGA